MKNNLNVRKSFVITKGHIWFNFCNGVVLSVFNGCCSHTENWFNHDFSTDIFESNEVEIAVLKNGKFITKEFYKKLDDDVITINICQFISLLKKVRDYSINTLD